jgi:hypothetical protein
MYSTLHNLNCKVIFESRTQFQFEFTSTSILIGVGRMKDKLNTLSCRTYDEWFTQACLKAEKTFLKIVRKKKKIFFSKQNRKAVTGVVNYVLRAITTKLFLFLSLSFSLFYWRTKSIKSSEWAELLIKPFFLSSLTCAFSFWRPFVQQNKI